LIVNSKEASLWQQLATHTKSVSESIKRLATSIKYVSIYAQCMHVVPICHILSRSINRDMTPGQQECERAIEQLRQLFQHVDHALTHVETVNKSEQSFEVGFRYTILACASSNNRFLLI
jgi:hypothetical protein